MRNITENENKPGITVYVNRFILLPLRAGLYGFAAVFTIIIFVKIAGFLFSSQTTFAATVGDIKTSMLGFAVMFILALFRSIIKKR